MAIDISSEANNEQEREFMEKMLEYAVGDYLSYAADSEEYQNACIWLFKDECDRYPALNHVCQILSLSKTRLRLKIQKLLDSGRVKISERSMRYLLDNTFIDPNKYFL